MHKMRQPAASNCNSGWSKVGLASHQHLPAACRLLALCFLCVQPVPNLFHTLIVQCFSRACSC